MKVSALTRILVLLLISGLFFVAGQAGPERSVYVSEVAWSGTQASWADEWIELGNATNRAIDLSGWTLSWDGVTIHLGTEKDNTLTVKNSTIDPGGVILLERSDDDPVSSIDADVIFKGSLANSGETLVLRNSEGKVVQKINGSEGWPAGTSSSGDPGYASMELENGEWSTHKDKGKNEDVAENLIYGTPGSLPGQSQ